MRSSGRGCRAGPSPPTRRASSSTHWPTCALVTSIALLISFSRKLVSDHGSAALGIASVRMKLPRLDSSESPTYGDQEGSAYNGHFGCTCYHPLFVFNQLGDAWAVRHVPDGRGRGVASNVQRNPVADRPAAGAACASMTEAVVRCDGRRCRVRLVGRTVTSFDEAATGRFVGQQNTPAAHRSGRSRVQLVNLANIAAYVVARIVLVPLSGQASGIPIK